MHRCLVFVVASAWPPSWARRPSSRATAMVWKAGTATSGGNPLNDTMEIFAKQMAERSRGRIKVDVHIANALAKGEAAHLEGVQLGTIDVVAIGSAPVGGMFEPSYQALDLPFLWATREQVWKVMDGPLGQELLKKMEAKNLKAFCFGGGWGFRNMMSNKRAITTPEDMKGQTIRVQESPTYVAMMKAMGANPVPMPYVEVYLAMKQGTIDGMELPSFTLTSDKFHEVTKYYSLTRHSYPPIAWFMNLKKVPGAVPPPKAARSRWVRPPGAPPHRVQRRRATRDHEERGCRSTGAGHQGLPGAHSRLRLVEGQVGKEFMAKLRAAVQAARPSARAVPRRLEPRRGFAVLMMVVLCGTSSGRLLPLRDPYTFTGTTRSPAALRVDRILGAAVACAQRPLPPASLSTASAHRAARRHVFGVLVLMASAGPDPAGLEAGGTGQLQRTPVMGLSKRYVYARCRGRRPGHPL